MATTGWRSTLATTATAVQEAGTKIAAAARVVVRREDQANTWLHRFILREIEGRARTRGAAYWDAIFPGLTPQARAERRIRRMLTRATVSGVLAAAGASAAEILSFTSDAAASPLAVPLGVVSVAGDLFYTTALRIDLSFDLASIYGVAFERDDVGELSTLLAMALGVDLVPEPHRHDEVATPGDTKPWHVARQMARDDFAQQIGKALLEQSVARNVVPVVGVLVSAVWNQIVLRRYAHDVHTAIRQRLAIVRACREVKLGALRAARTVLEGAWLMATADGDLRHEEALALATLIDELPVPDRIAVNEASFPEDQEAWFDRLAELEPPARDTLVRVLMLVASADGELSTPERRLLRRVGRALGRVVDLDEAERMAEQVRLGDVPHAPVQLAPPLAPATS